VLGSLSPQGEGLTVSLSPQGKDSHPPSPLGGGLTVTLSPEGRGQGEGWFAPYLGTTWSSMKLRTWDAIGYGSSPLTPNHLS